MAATRMAAVAGAIGRDDQVAHVPNFAWAGEAACVTRNSNLAHQLRQNTEADMLIWDPGRAHRGSHQAGCSALRLTYLVEWAAV